MKLKQPQTVSLGQALIIKHYRFVMYGLRSKLVCLPYPIKVTDNNKNTSLPRNLSIFCSLSVCNVL
jgi:hypothetical protein